LRHQTYTLYYRDVCIFDFLHVFAYFMLLRCMLKFKRLACGSDDVTQYNTMHVEDKCCAKAFLFIVYLNLPQTSMRKAIRVIRRLSDFFLLVKFFAAVTVCSKWRVVPILQPFWKNSFPKNNVERIQCFLHLCSRSARIYSFQ